MAAASKKSLFTPFGPEDWYETDAMELVQPKSSLAAIEPDSAPDISSFASANLPQKAAVEPSTDWGGVAQAGVGAAGAAAGALAQVAGQKYAMDRAMESNNAARMLSERLAKMQIAASQDQFAREQNLRALLWALNANKGQQATSGSARDVRRNAIEGMDELLAKVMLKRG